MTAQEQTLSTYHNYTCKALDSYRNGAHVVTIRRPSDDGGWYVSWELDYGAQDGRTFMDSRTYKTRKGAERKAAEWLA